nr:uncharacterized protein CTRU02_06010 [Colletotrichum truncatum]KAF6793138.1 hypothetical protein CTRU02_06010 [Colletotrichum truncatum]
MPVIDARLLQEGAVEVGSIIMKRAVDHTVLETLAVRPSAYLGLGASSTGLIGEKKSTWLPVLEHRVTSTPTLSYYLSTKMQSRHDSMIQVQATEPP